MAPLLGSEGEEGPKHNPPAEPQRKLSRQAGSSTAKSTIVAVSFPPVRKGETRDVLGNQRQMSVWEKKRLTVLAAGQLPRTSSFVTTSSQMTSAKRAQQQQQQQQKKIPSSVHIQALSRHAACGFLSAFLHRTHAGCSGHLSGSSGPFGGGGGGRFCPTLLARGPSVTRSLHTLPA